MRPSLEPRCGYSIFAGTDASRSARRPTRSRPAIKLPAKRTGRLDAVYDSASDGPSQIAKAKLRDPAEALGRNAADVCRAAARLEAGRKQSGIQPAVEGLQDALQQWRAML